MINVCIYWRQKFVSMIDEQERIVVKNKKVPSKSGHVKSMALMS